MFDAGHGGGPDCVSGFENEPDRSERRQYTLKGIESETIQLMREAAKKEGMKIGSWVSSRMKEAAEQALSSETARDYQKKVANERSAASESSQQATSLNSALDTEERLALIERELRELVSGQRAIMANLLLRSS